MIACATAEACSRPQSLRTRPEFFPTATLCVKEGAQIVDLLNIMGAHVSLMDFENVRILKEMPSFIPLKSSAMLLSFFRR